MAVGKDGSVYVGEIGEGRLLKFQDVNVAGACVRVSWYQYVHLHPLGLIQSDLVYPAALVF